MIIQPPNNYIIFDHQNLSVFDLHISGNKTFGSPKRDVEEIKIPGRSGTLTYDKGRFDNYSLEYEASILGKDERDFYKKITLLRNFLSSRINYKRLEDSYHPDEYRMAKFVDGFDPDIVLMQGGSFTLEFDCKPQRFLKSGEEKFVFTESNTIFNPTYFESRPIIRVYGHGVIHIGDVDVTISDFSSTELPYIDIDCDIRDSLYVTASSSVINCNGFVSLYSNDYYQDYPILKSGLTEINIESGIEKIEIYPRWYII